MKNLILILATCFLIIGCTKSSKNEEFISYTDICEGYDAIDLEMLETIEQIESENKEDIKFLERFRDSQIYWIQYKDRHLRSLYPEDWDLYYRKNYGKQVFNSCKCKELIRLTNLRIKELKWYLEAGGPDGQTECPSSWNKKSP